MHQRMALSMHAAGAKVEYYSEVESWPHTRFTKSVFFTRRQMEMHTLAGADALSLNLYDFLANPIAQEPAFGRLLKAEKERLGIIQAARRGKSLRGFGLPWKKDAAAHVVCRSGKVDDLLIQRPLDGLLPRFGIPIQHAPARANAVLGDEIEAFSDEEVRGFLKGGLMLDAVALEHLQRRGFGDLLGCRVSGTLTMAAAERLEAHPFCGGFAGNLLATSWFRSQPEGKAIPQLEMANGAFALSTLVGVELAEMGPGMVGFENRLGGRVAVMAVPIHSYWNWPFRSRAYVVRQVARWLMRDELPVWVEDCVDVGPIYYEDPRTGEGLLAIVNASLDDQPVRLHTGLDVRDLFGKGRAGVSRKIPALGIQFYQTNPKPAKRSSP